MKNSPFSRFAVDFLLAVLLVAVVGLFIDDPLLYHSPPFDLATIAAFLAFVGAALMFLITVPLAHLLKAWLPEKLAKTESACILGVMAAGLTISILEFVAGLTLSPAQFLLVTLAAFAVGFAGGYSAPIEILDRIRILALVTVAMGFFLVVGRFAWSATEDLRYADVGSPHAILVVIDGWPAQLWNRYSPDRPVSAIDELADQGRLFTAAYTSRTFTWGWFSVFYTGRLDGTPGRYDRGDDLLGRLSKAGVKTRVINFHSNGLPDSVAKTDRQVLRSNFLTERYTWIPELLGIEYDVFLGWPLTRQNLPPRSRALYDLTSGLSDDELWDEFFPAQISDLNGGNRPSFLIIHVSHNLSTVQSLGAALDDEAVRDLYERAERKGYRYKTEDEPVMALVRQKYAKRTDLWGRRLAELNRQIGRLGGNQLVIATADHGSILSRGKIWYGYHIDEEVTRVPLLLLGSKIEPAVRTERVDTLDIRATVLAFFGIESSGSGRSLLTKRPLSEHTVASVGLASPVVDEQFVALYRNGAKYIFNILPTGDGGSQIERYSGFRSVGSVTSPVPTDDSAWRELGTVLKAYGYSERTVHPKIWSSVQAIAPHASPSLAGSR